jgi:hypothetical protein
MASRYVRGCQEADGEEGFAKTRRCRVKFTSLSDLVRLSHHEHNGLWALLNRPSYARRSRDTNVVNSFTVPGARASDRDGRHTASFRA